jgi:hypothetical protein
MYVCLYLYIPAYIPGSRPGGTAVLWLLTLNGSGHICLHSLPVPGYFAIVRQSTRTMALLYESVLQRTEFP